MPPTKPRTIADLKCPQDIVGDYIHKEMMKEDKDWKCLYDRCKEDVQDLLRTLIRELDEDKKANQLDMKTCKDCQDVPEKVCYYHFGKSQAIYGVRDFAVKLLGTEKGEKI